MDRAKPKRTIEDVLLIINRQAKRVLEKAARNNSHGQAIVRINLHGPQGPGKVRAKLVETEKPE